MVRPSKKVSPQNMLQNKRNHFYLGVSVHVPKYLHIAANPLDPFPFSVFVRAIPLTDIQYTLSFPPVSYTHRSYLWGVGKAVCVRVQNIVGWGGVGWGVLGEKVSSVADGEKMSVPYRNNDLLIVYLTCGEKLMCLKDRERSFFYKKTISNIDSWGKNLRGWTAGEGSTR